MLISHSINLYHFLFLDNLFPASFFPLHSTSSVKTSQFNDLTLSLHSDSMLDGMSHILKFISEVRAIKPWSAQPGVLLIPF